MPFNIIRADITKTEADAVVNAANTSLAPGGGVCGAIFNAAGKAELSAACEKLAPIKTGEAVITPGFNMTCKYIIHTAGPVYGRQSEEESKKLLISSYANSLMLARENGCESVVFPLISSGIYGYPKKEALRVAVKAISDFLDNYEMSVFLAVFDKASFSISEELTRGVTSYIDDNYAQKHTLFRREQNICASEALTEDDDAICGNACFSHAASSPAHAGIEDLVGRLDEPFSDTLLRLIDAKGKTDSEVYKRANIDRKLFSKIRTGVNYTPSKRTALALAVALELNINETNDLLRRAGYALSHSRKFDVIIEYFIINGFYDIFEINEVLFKFDQPLLGG